MSRAVHLAELLPDVPGVPADLVVGGLKQDSRALRAGDAFVAIAGFGAHGLKFVEQARAAGARAKRRRCAWLPPRPGRRARYRCRPAARPSGATRLP